ncbi:MAG: serine hydrolase domain-containing protein, partial [Terriglobales bacterium]
MRTLRTSCCYVLAVVLACAFSVPAAAQTSKRKPPARTAAKPRLSATADERFSAVDVIFEQAVKQHQIPGAVVLVGHDGKVVYRKAYGSRSLEPRRETMTLDTIFDMASLTKCLVTTTAVMRLVQYGQVRLNDPVARYLPEFGSNGKQDITVRQLLTH